MKKKNYLWSVLTATALLLLYFGFVSCDEKEDNSVVPETPTTPNNPNNSGVPDTTLDSSLLIGTWRYTSYKTDDYEIFEFRENQIYKHEGLANGDFYSENGIWSLDVNNRKLKLYHDDTTEEAEIVRLTDTELMVFNAIYYRVTGGENGSTSEDNQSDNNGNRGEVAASFKGSGTQSDPYIISSAAELRKMSDDAANGEDYYGKCFQMTADIAINQQIFDKNGNLIADTTKLEKWIPIETFKGVFNGQGHVIRGIYMTSGSGRGGLFGKAENATIENLIIEDAFITHGVTGGVVGLASDVFINKCICRKSLLIMDRGNYIGGIAGFCTGVIQNCANYAKIAADGFGCGGIVGDVKGTSKVVNCVNKGMIKGLQATSHYSGGGIVGAVRRTKNTTLTFKNNVNTGIVSYGGAIIGCLQFNDGIIYITDNYYLDESAECYICYYEFESFYSSSTTKSNNVAVSSEKMKSQDFLDQLNNETKGLGSQYSQWKFGKDGYPTLDFVNE